MGCCGGHTYDDLVSLMSPGKGEGPSVVRLEPGPDFIRNPLTGRKDLPRHPNTKQMFVRGVRLGYVNVIPGGPIFFVRYWKQPELEVLHEAILEAIIDAGHDVEEPRKWSQPPQKGLRQFKDEDAAADEEKSVVLPD